MPDVNVTYIQETPIYAGPHPDHAEMVFNPRLGFTSDLAQADSDSGSYICNYERDGVEETQMVIITVHRKLFMNNSNFLYKKINQCVYTKLSTDVPRKCQSLSKSSPALLSALLFRS